MAPLQKITDRSAAMAPTIIRIQPTASMLTPFASSVTPHTRMAPTAMRMAPTVKPAGEIMSSVFPPLAKLTRPQRDEDDLPGRAPVVSAERVGRRQLLQAPDLQARLGERRQETAQLDSAAVEVVAAPAEDVVETVHDRVVVVMQEVTARAERAQDAVRVRLDVLHPRERAPRSVDELEASAQELQRQPVELRVHEGGVRRAAARRLEVCRGRVDGRHEGAGLRELGSLVPRPAAQMENVPPCDVGQALADDGRQPRLVLRPPRV